MVRRSLSARVVEEIDRTRGLLRPVQDITDPMTAHVIGEALESLHRIETMCLSTMQQAMNEVILEKTFEVGDDGMVREDKSKRKTGTLPTAHKRSRKA